MTTQEGEDELVRQMFELDARLLSFKTESMKYEIERYAKRKGDEATWKLTVAGLALNAGFMPIWTPLLNFWHGKKQQEAIDAQVKQAFDLFYSSSHLFPFQIAVFRRIPYEYETGMELVEKTRRQRFTTDYMRRYEWRVFNEKMQTLHWIYRQLSTEPWRIREDLWNGKITTLEAFQQQDQLLKECRNKWDDIMPQHTDNYVTIARLGMGGLRRSRYMWSKGENELISGTKYCVRCGLEQEKANFCSGCGLKHEVI